MAHAALEEGHLRNGHVPSERSHRASWLGLSTAAPTRQDRLRVLLLCARQDAARQQVRARRNRTPSVVYSVSVKYCLEHYGHSKDPWLLRTKYPQITVVMDDEEGGGEAGASCEPRVVIREPQPSSTRRRKRKADLAAIVQEEEDAIVVEADDFLDETNGEIAYGEVRVSTWSRCFICRTAKCTLSSTRTRRSSRRRS